MPLPAKELRALLKLTNVKVPKYSRHDDLWRLCLENGLVEREFENVTNITVVKSSLQAALNLENRDFDKLSEVIEQYVSIVSRLLRRSSLVFHFHILRLHEEGKVLPNFYKLKDTYWKLWLTIGLSSAFPDPDAKESYDQVKGLFEEPNLAEEIKNLKYFDQILNYAGHTFSTSISNNSWYPLFNKLTRVSKMEASEWELKDVNKYTVMRMIRSPVENLDTTMPDQVLEFVRDVKARLLSADNEEYISDKHAKENMTFDQAFKFNMWMQTRFASFEARMTRLAPTFSVQRAHIRLDTKTLAFLLKDLFPEKDAVKRFNYETLLTSLFPDPIDELKKSECTPEEWKDYLRATKAYKAEVKRIRNSKEYLKRKADMKSKVPLKSLLPPKIKTLKKKDCTSEEWTRYNTDKAARKAEINRIKTSDEQYLQQEAINAKNKLERMKLVSSFFKGTNRKDWTFDCSIQTDGVSLSRQFSREKRVERTPKPKVEDPKIVEAYNKNLSCFIKAANTLVVGLDPGRINLACLSYIWVKDDGSIEKNSWSMKRAQYYNDSGINVRSQKKAVRMKSLEASWSKIGTLKATSSSQVIEYVTKYNEVKNEWWKLAMKKKEARSKLDNYSGKKKVLDTFFHQVKRDLKVTHPEVNIKIAYGSAFNGMSSSGRGEVSAPIGQVYKTCIRHFDTVVENEDCSTKTSFETGQDMKKVYKTFYKVNNKVFESFGHCNMNALVSAKSDQEKELLDAYYASSKRKKKKEEDDAFTIKEEAKRRLNFPVIRGLQFCQETCMYVDRDVKASVTIARLAVMRIVGNERPRAFVKQTKNSKAGEKEETPITEAEE